MRRTVVVTGIGVITPVGNDRETFWSALIAGRSGIGPITRFDATNFPCRIAGEVKGFNPLDWVERKEAGRMDEYAIFALAAAVQAMRDAGLERGTANADRMGVIVGSGIGGIRTFEEQHIRYLAKGNQVVSPFFVPMLISDIAAGLISMRWGLKGPNYGVVSACATASNAIGDAMRLIRYGDADVILAGASEATITPMALAGFGNMKALSRRNDAPERASRPFDANRDGFVMGEGAGILVLEAEEHARARGAHIHGELAGYGATADAHHITAPAPGGEGAIRAMRRAMEDANITPEEVDYINAHGTSTPYNDKNETAAIHAVFGEHARRVSVSSTKSMTGHLLGASGGIEAAASLLAIRDGVIPPTVNYQTPDPECDLDCTPNVPKRREVRIAMSNTFGFGGHNAVLVMKRMEN